MKSFPELHTKRLLLRKIRSTDFPSLLRYVNHPSISDNLLNYPYPFLEKDAQERLSAIEKGFEAKQRYTFAIILKESEELIGEIGLGVDRENNRAELGYWIGEPFWGQGMMTEAVAKMLNFGFQTLKLHKIFATHFLSNPASGKILERNGMILEGELKDQYRHQGQYRSVRLYRLTSDEYNKLSKM